MEERLQKIIARAGIASRRRAEEMITSGLVTVNGRTVTELGTKADLSRDHIKVAGKLLRAEEQRVYLALNKPAEVVSTMSDPEGRRSLRDLLHGISERVFPVGGLEYHATGLILLTNDGDFANQLLKSDRIRQTYHLKLKNLLTFSEIETLSRITGAHISRLRGTKAPWYEVSLSESPRGTLENKLFQMQHPVERMKRISLAGIELGHLQGGMHRELSPQEVRALMKAVSGEASNENSVQSPGKNRRRSRSSLRERSRKRPEKS